MRTLLFSVAAASVLLLSACGGSSDTATKTVVVVVSTPAADGGPTAQAHVRSAVPSVEAYYFDNSTYLGATMAKLKELDSEITSDVTIHDVSADRYCLESTVDGATVSLSRPGDSYTDGPCP